MLPIDIEGPVIKRPIATYALIIANAVVYLLTSYPNGFLQVSQYWLEKLSFIPILILDPTQLYRFITSMFLHADIFHILFNMYFLFIFGREVESILGRWRYLMLYFIGGIIASLFHIGFSGVMGIHNVLIPALGASGAMSSVLGASLLLYPHRRMTVCWFIWFIPWCFNIRTVYLLLIWFAMQVTYGYASMTGVAFFAHAGGFIAGIALLAFLIPSHIRREEIKSIYNFFTGEYIFVRRRGIGSTEKAIIIILLTALLIGGIYSYYAAGYEGGSTYVYAIDAKFQGTEEMDYAIYNVGGYVVSYPAGDLPRIVWNRIYWAGLLKGKPNYNGTLKFNDLINAPGYNVHVKLKLDSKAAYDGKGILVYVKGHMVTDVIITRGTEISIKKNIPIDFEMSGYGPLTQIGNELIQPIALFSSLITLFSIYVVLARDKELVLD